jgi:hypothetical protein
MNMSTTTEYLKLGETFWRGSIPDIFRNYEALEYFDVTGTLPASAFSILSIRFIYMHEYEG